MQKEKFRNKTDLRICVVDFPYPKRVRHSYKFTYNLVRILKNVASTQYIISDNLAEYKINDKNIHLREIGIAPHFLRDIKPKWFSLLLWIFKNILIQLRICINLLKVSKKVDVVIFFMMLPYTEVLPMFFAKLLGKVIIKVPLGVAPRDRIYAPFVYKLFEKMSLCLSDYYIPEYETNTKQLKRYEQLKYPQKLLPAAHFFVLEDEFKIMKTINERENVVGYIGGFREIKGIVNFVKAIPLVLNKDNEIRFLIAGEGVLKNEIEKLIRKYPENKVTLIDWIPHEEVPKYLNELKLLVIPSYSEGVPNIAIEAMACGTPILSTKVGVIPMLIQNGKNGFILEDNSPECIASSIIEVLSRGNSYLKKIANNARYLIDEKYKFHSIVERWRRILNEIDKNLLAD